MALEVNDANFEEVVLKSPIPVIVDFWATWCGPCRQMLPYLEQVAEEYAGKFTFCKCNVENCSAVPVKYSVRNVPTLLFFKNGELAAKAVGLQKKGDIVSKLEQLL